MTVNFQRALDKTLAELTASGQTPRLLLHSCCAPCSSYVIEYLTEYFEMTIYYYNPNIYPDSEYEKRVAEQQELIRAVKTRHPVTMITEEHRASEFYEKIKGLEDLPEGGARCLRCYKLRLEETAKKAKELGFDFFTTTLSISPLKNAEALNGIGEALGREYGVRHLMADFKKKDGYKRSVELSKQYGLYRQDYCGCVYSMNERSKI